MKDFDEMLALVEPQPLRKIAVACAQDAAVIEAVPEALRRNVAETALVGDEEQIRDIASSVGADLSGATVVNEPGDLQAVAAATRMVSEGQADILMKGFIHTDDFLRGVLDKEHGLRTGSIMSHVFIVEARELEKFVFVTDGAMNIAPDLAAKSAILLNAVFLARHFGVAEPRVAVLAAVELVNPAMPATVDAAVLAKMADRRQYIPPCVVDGPFALDNAVSPRAAKHKKLTGEVAGQADILLVPNIEAGNMLSKALVYLGGKRQIGLLVGASAPVVLTSRADTAECKLLSMAGAVLMVNMKRHLKLKVGKVHY
jgi:phosphate butyryltransferase